ncbi:MAG: hypothetical protein A2096_16470 [Spirochaetes bacterium GWF1_41_5]|nr:MAG: hypothetical protein A2096_16470 [Spirochaetes bacterium GWF1_41_5]
MPDQIKELFTARVLVIGTGAAGYNAAVHCSHFGLKPVIITNRRTYGTSRNTGSDKQTYYKTGLSAEGDSVRAMTQTLFSGGAVDGDLALCEAAHSLQEFFHLVSIGVRFPHNRWGEYPGYKTDHDPCGRASSTGPFTSKAMTECLEQEAGRLKIPVYEGIKPVKILSEKNTVYGLIVLKNHKLKIIYADYIIFATGGPAQIYDYTVYPRSQASASGVLAQAGLSFVNMGEWQYGIGSTVFRWNLSGSYQQIIPRYVSLDENGKEYEFLEEWFSPAEIGKAIFRKGYEWPFHPEKLCTGGSSLIDLAVYQERYLRGRRVFLDFTRNPSGIKSPLIKNIGTEAAAYLEKSGVNAPTPVQRLKQLNPQSYFLYLDHKIDLAKEYLAVDILPQHHNGGVKVDCWWQTEIKNLFCVGEAAGTHGVTRPGGAALNAGQTGGYRAALYIAGCGKTKKTGRCEISDIRMFNNSRRSYSGRHGSQKKEMQNMLTNLKKLASRHLVFIRSREGAQIVLDECRVCLRALSSYCPETDNYHTYFELSEVTALLRLFASSVLHYIRAGGKSRGSYLINAKKTGLNACKKTASDRRFHGKIQEVKICRQKIKTFFRPVRPVPKRNDWFEKVWHEYTGGEIFRQNRRAS